MFLTLSCGCPFEVHMVLIFLLLTNFFFFSFFLFLFFFPFLFPLSPYEPNKDAFSLFSCTNNKTIFQRLGGAAWVDNGTFGRLGLVLSKFAVEVGWSVANQRWFGGTPVWMDFCCFNSSFLPLLCDNGSRWGRCYVQRLACWREVWWRQTFNFSHMLLHLFGEFFIPREEFWQHHF